LIDRVVSVKTILVAPVVVIDALNERNVEGWSLPTPSAFSADDIAAVGRRGQWLVRFEVARGGAEPAISAERSTLAFRPDA